MLSPRKVCWLPLEFEMELLKKSGAFTTTLVVEGEPYTLPAQKVLILFRIFQETINNIIKHAKATSIEVYVYFYTGTLVLQINDNGQGFDITGISNNGMGLKNIKNRSQLIEADYNLYSQPGKGTSIKIALPAPDVLEE